MENRQSMTGRAKLSYALGAVGKDMVYMLSASYVLYYFQDVMGVSAIAMGAILLAARVFDAFNDPVMGVIVARTGTRWGRFRPWLLIGTLTNAAVLYLMFAAPPAMDAAGLTAYAAVTYVLWGVTYTMMDIPYWSMIPALTESGRERESLTTLARSAAGVGSALVSVLTVKLVQVLGAALGGANAREIEIVGFRYFSLGVAALFVVFTLIMCANVRERSTAGMEAVSVGRMFGALLRNDQAMAVTVTIVLVNGALYITSNLVLYFFKYDFGGANWYDSYTLFTAFGGGVQILSMMLLYPLLRNGLGLGNIRVFHVAMGMGAAGYAALLALTFTSMSGVLPLCLPALLIFAANGVNSILTTVFLADAVDYGELKNGRRDESVIFSMQTFVVKLASGLAAFVASVCLQINRLSGAAVSEADKAVDFSASVSAGAKLGLRMTMAAVPVVLLALSFLWFRRRYVLTEEKAGEIAEKLRERRAAGT